MFQFTTTEKADVHVAVMQVFGEANERFETALTLESVQSALPAIGWFQPIHAETLETTLRSLVEWGLLDRTQNHAAHYTTAEEFERRNLQYSLTKKGEAAVAGVEHAMQALSTTGALQTAVLDAIADRLNELYGLLRDETSADRRVFSALTELETHLDGLRTNTRQFNNQLQRLLRDEGGESDTFQEVKQATVTYLHEFVTDLDERRQAIEDAIGRVQGAGVDLLHRRALAGANLPALPGADPAPRFLQQRALRWDGLERWFQPADGRRPQVEELRDIARRAILSLMRVLEQLSEARRRRSSAAADFRALARWFAACPTDDDAHGLFNAAFGLWPARHAHLALDDPETAPPSSRWEEAPRVHVSPLLRTHGKLEHIARTARARDVTELRQLRRLRAIRERSELESAWRQLATPGTVRLSHFADLDHDSFERLLELLGRALAMPPGPEGARRATTLDGRLEVMLSEPDTGRRAVLRTPRGQLVAPDYRVRVAPTTVTAAAAAGS
ncbi:MAG: TIGR02677 family protein [bacterium]|jgi:uncharacterized protein (TIGR02677 family)|nr:TIGR02677 family protein [bacterium]